MGRRERAVWLWTPFVALVAWWFANTSDDSFITLRYARNVLRGHGPVFNPGERVEGFTSPLHLLVSVGVVAVPGDRAMLVAKLVSTAVAALAVAVSARLVNRLVAEGTLPERLQGPALALVGGSWIVAATAANALETSLAALTAGLLLVRVLGDRRSPADQAVLAVLAAACVLTRPELAVLVAVVALVDVARRRGAPGRLAWIPAGVALLAVTALVRHGYYGAWLPNTFEAKRASRSTAFTAGLEYLGRSFQPIATRSPEDWVDVVATVAAVAGAALFVVGALRARASGPTLRLLAAVATAHLALFPLIGGDWMLGARLTAPVAVPIVLVQLAGALWISRARPVPAWWGVAGMAMLAVATLPSLPIWSIDLSFDDAALMAAGPFDGGWEEGPEVVTCARPGDLVALSEMGFGPWERGDLRFVDLRGLITRRIAVESDGAEKTTTGVVDPDWSDRRSPPVAEVLRRRPVLVIVGGDRPAPALEQDYRVIERGTWGLTYLRRDRRC